MKWYRDPVMLVTITWVIGTFALGYAGFTGMALLCAILCPLILILIG